MKFNTFLKEYYGVEANQAKDAHEPTDEASSSIHNPQVVAQINTQLFKELNVDGFKVPQDGVQKIRKVLNSYGMDFPALYELDPEGDETTFDICQYDDHNKTTFLYLLYSMADNGHYEFFAQIGDEDTINALVEQEPEED